MTCGKTQTSPRIVLEPMTLTTCYWLLAQRQVVITKCSVHALPGSLPKGTQADLGVLHHSSLSRVVTRWQQDAWDGHQRDTGPSTHRQHDLTRVRMEKGSHGGRGDVGGCRSGQSDRWQVRVMMARIARRGQSRETRHNVNKDERVHFIRNLPSRLPRLRRYLSSSSTGSRSV